MKLIRDFTQNSKEWHDWRNGKITGTSLKEIVGYREMLKDDLMKIVAKYTNPDTIKKMKVDELRDLINQNDPDFKTKRMTYKNGDYLYKLLAYELSDGTAPDEDPANRGKRLEHEAIEAFTTKTQKTVEHCGGIEHSDNSRIAVSPDGIIFNPKTKTYDEGVEAKCLAGWKHIKIWRTNSVLDEHFMQVMQYFNVNDDFKKMYYVSYCPEITIHPVHIVEINRDDYKTEIADVRQVCEDCIADLENALNEIYKL